MSKTILSPRKQASQIFESLHAAAKSGTLTTVQLSQAVRFVYDDGNTFHCSAGTEWIRNNHVAFATCVGTDAEDFFRQHIDIWQLISVSMRPELLTIIAPERRTAYVQDVVRKCSLFGWWVKAAFHSGITRTDIAALLLERIKSSPQREAEYFLVRGAGNLPAEWQPQLLPEDEPWAMLDDEELAMVIRLCIPHAPREVFNHRRALTIRLGEVTANLLCEEATSQLQSALYLTLEQLRPLSLETRLNLARRITLTPGDNATDISAQLICDVILDLAESGYGGRKVWKLSDEADELFDKIRWAPMLYQAAHTLGRPVPAWLETWLMDRLTLNGFLVGTLEYGMCQPKDASQPVQQLQLRHGNHIFVQSSRQSHYYFPREGERVIVQPSQARHLTHRDGKHILAAYFTPATRFLP